jgi:EAL and modified HD-GYP domain-containing signal transduction protein
MTDLPLIRLHPVADGHHGWAALMLATKAPLECDVLARLFGELGLFQALGSLPCVVDLATPHSSDEIDALVPAEQIVLRIPAATCVGEADCAAVRRLHGLGFRLMAVGLAPGGKKPCSEFEAISLTCAEASLSAGLLAKWQGRHLALQVDTPQDFERCRQAGFRWLAGSYPLHPIGGHQPGGTTRHALLLRLLTLISRDAESDDIEHAIKQDAHLSYQLLRLVNSVAFSLSHKITSFRQAITILGRRQLQRWLQLLLYARPEGGGKSPLLPRAAARAALMEALCAGSNRDVQERAFMAGMFSLLDVLMGGKLADIVTPLNLADDIVQALLDRAGPLGPLLTAVEAGEQRDDEALSSALTGAGIDHTAWAIALIRSYRWAIQVSLEA